MKVILAMAAGLALSSTAMAQWTASSIQSGDVRFQVGGGASAGGAFAAAFNSATSSAVSLTADFRTTGAAGTDHAFSAWWWYRANNDTRERNIASPSGSNAVTKITNPDSVNYDGIQPEITGANSALRFNLSFSVVDLDGAGGNMGQVISTLTVTNTGTAAAIGVSLFNYVDYFFTGEDAGDQVLAGNAGVDAGGRFIRVTDATDTTSPSFGLLEHYGRGATGYGAGSFSAVGGQMGDTSVDNFADFNNATVAGDQSGVLQWDFGNIDAGASASATAVISIIPAPGSAALLGLGGLLVARRRRA